MIYITDFYREIIEDYSAIPRYLQQQYGLIHGKDHGRIWRLTHQGSVLSRHANLSILSHQQLVARLASERVWERKPPNACSSKIQPVRWRRTSQII